MICSSAMPSVLCPFLHAAGTVQGRVELSCNCMVLEGAVCFCIPCIPCILASPHLCSDRNRRTVLPLPAGSGYAGCAGDAVEPLKQQSSAVINIQQTEQVLGRPGCSEGALTSGGSSVCFSFHLSALIFRAFTVWTN